MRSLVVIRSFPINIPLTMFPNRRVGTVGREEFLMKSEREMPLSGILSELGRGLQIFEGFWSLKLSEWARSIELFIKLTHRMRSTPYTSPYHRVRCLIILVLSILHDKAPQFRAKFRQSCGKRNVGLGVLGGERLRAVSAIVVNSSVACTGLSKESIREEQSKTSIVHAACPSLKIKHEME